MLALTMREAGSTCLPFGFTSHRDSCTSPPSRPLSLTLVKPSLTLAQAFEVGFQLGVFASSAFSYSPASALLHNNHWMVQLWITYSSAPKLSMAPHCLQNEIQEFCPLCLWTTIQTLKISSDSLFSRTFSPCHPFRISHFRPSILLIYVLVWPPP